MKILAFVLEPIFGEGGVYECSVEFLQECRAVADRHRAALIFDEIQCGLGRTGNIFAFQTFGVTPDIVAVAKPIAAGLPLGAFLAREEFASAISPGQHGTTFGGGPLACRVALEYLAIVEEEKLLENIVRVGNYLKEQLKLIIERHAKGSSRPRIDSRPPVGSSGPSARGTGAGRGSFIQQHTRFRAAISASIPAPGETCGQRYASFEEVAGQKAAENKGASGNIQLPSSATIDCSERHIGPAK